MANTTIFGTPTGFGKEGINQMTPGTGNGQWIAATLSELTYHYSATSPPQDWEIVSPPLRRSNEDSTTVVLKNDRSGEVLVATAGGDKTRAERALQDPAVLKWLGSYYQDHPESKDYRIAFANTASPTGINSAAGRSIDAALESVRENYPQGKGQYYLPPGWEVVSPPLYAADVSKADTMAVVLKNDSSGQLVIANRGTIATGPAGVANWGTDFAPGDHGMSNAAALEPVVKQWVGQYLQHPENKHYELSTDGHSLGGAIAQAQSLRFGTVGMAQNSDAISVAGYAHYLHHVPWNYLPDMMARDTIPTDIPSARAVVRFQNDLEAWNENTHANFFNSRTKGDPLTNALGPLSNVAEAPNHFARADILIPGLPNPNQFWYLNGIQQVVEDHTRALSTVGANGKAVQLGTLSDLEVGVANVALAGVGSHSTGALSPEGYPANRDGYLAAFYQQYKDGITAPHSTARRGDVIVPDSSDRREVIDERESTLSAPQKATINTLKDVMRARGDSEAAIAKAAAMSTDRFQSNRLYVGKVLEHGAAPYESNPRNEMSYYVKLGTPKGEKVIWGVDLQRAVAESGIRSGAEVAVANRGRMEVAVKPGEAGATRGSEIVTSRNVWVVRDIQKLPPEARQALNATAEKSDQAPRLAVPERQRELAVQR
jgi:hypothetical protein